MGNFFCEDLEKTEAQYKRICFLEDVVTETPRMDDLDNIKSLQVIKFLR